MTLGGASYLPPGSLGGVLWQVESNPHSTIFENIRDTMEWKMRLNKTSIKPWVKYLPVGQEISFGAI